MRAKILKSGINLDGKQLKKGSIEELPWQLVNNWAVRGWVKPIEETPKGGEKDDNEADSKTDTGTGNAAGSEGLGKDNNK